MNNGPSVSAGESQVAVFTRADSTSVPKVGAAATWLTILKSEDGRFESGFYQSGPEHEEYREVGYENDEFCYILTGSIVLTAADGRMDTVAPGDAVSIPKGWKGRWDSNGYTKLFVIYHCDLR
jgi:uncharacterized cupin superfamily protein